MTNDPYLWLEDLESDASLAWVNERNAKMEARLGTSPFYRQAFELVQDIMLDKDRLPLVQERGGFVFNFWQDEEHPRGVWRRVRLEDFRSAEPSWEILLDLDRLASDENENWVWKGAEGLATDPDRFLVWLSRGGQDASVLREYDLRSKAFVRDGFSAPEAKSSVAWLDQDTVLISTDFGPGSMSSSGYPRQVRRWRRGQKLEEADLIFEASANDMSAHGGSIFTPAGRASLIVRQIGFYSTHLFLLSDELPPHRLDVPEDAVLLSAYQDRLLFLLRSPWNTVGGEWPVGAVVSLSWKNLKAAPSLVYSPPEGVFIRSVESTSEGIFVSVLENVQGRLLRLAPMADGSWQASTVKGAPEGHLDVVSSDPLSPTLLAVHEGFLSPSSIWSLDASTPDTELRLVKSLKPKFAADRFVVESFAVASRDGVSIPYSVVRPKDLAFDGGAPTLLYGYGGFGNALTPFYLGAYGKVWLEKAQGVYVLANIRGGGEFGPNWHMAVLKENRQNAFDDFIAIAEDLVRRKITSPKHLGIVGGSNGGLLVGAAMTQRPDLFGAVVCQVPLLDMLRYHLLLAGHSWMDEYGDPDDPAMREVIARYSPYQNLREGLSYPEMFLMTSLKDDRVHPGHARKMAARLEELGQPVSYFENMEGGHGASANLAQRVRFMALMMSFLYGKLAGEERP